MPAPVPVPAPFAWDNLLAEHRRDHSLVGAYFSYRHPKHGWLAIQIVAASDTHTELQWQAVPPRPSAPAPTVPLDEKHGLSGWFSTELDKGEWSPNGLLVPQGVLPAKAHNTACFYA
jgi:hypothetical protein